MPLNQAHAVPGLMENCPSMRNLGRLVLGANIENRKFYFYVDSKTRILWALELEFYVASGVLFSCGLQYYFIWSLIRFLSCLYKHRNAIENTI